MGSSPTLADLLQLNSSEPAQPLPDLSDLLADPAEVRKRVEGKLKRRAAEMLQALRHFRAFRTIPSPPTDRVERLIADLLAESLVAFEADRSSRSVNQKIVDYQDSHRSAAKILKVCDKGEAKRLLGKADHVPPVIQKPSLLRNDAVLIDHLVLSLSAVIWATTRGTIREVAGRCLPAIFKATASKYPDLLPRSGLRSPYERLKTLARRNRRGRPRTKGRETLSVQGLLVQRARKILLRSGLPVDFARLKT